MEKEEILYNSFLKEIVQKVPQKTEVVKVLSNILSINREDVTRKLKGEESFTFYEIMTISGQLDISLDHLKMNGSLITEPFRMKLIEYINPVETDFALMEEMTAIMRSFNSNSDSEAAEITNILPQPLYLPYKNITRFYLFKWKYQSNLNKAMPYKDVVLADKLLKVQAEYVEWAKRLRASYIFDHLLFHYLVADIRYFYSAGLMTREEVQLIKQELLDILDEIADLSNTGIFRETGKRVDIYISYVNVGTNYIYVSAPDYHLTIIKAFILNGIATTDKRVSEELKLRVQSMKRQSTLITGSSEKERVGFLEEQRKVIESLSQL
ncbi:MAG: hypothetical protein LBV72_08295 [Tannerella sp.]|jgi:hypothetical protein|nr:hypothetical protein [Tannerella sp.]